MSKSRLEAFSDGVIAVALTLMVLEIKIPHGPELSELRSLAPAFLAYVLSYVYVGIYWNNHHHMLLLAPRINGRIMWANLFLLFWLCLIPLVTAWNGENPGQRWPTVCYGAVLLMTGVAYYLLELSIIAEAGKDSEFSKAVGTDLKGRLSLVLYASAIGVAFVAPWVSNLGYVAVALMWFIPDTRIERRFANAKANEVG